MRTNFKSKRFQYNGIHKKVVPTHEKRGRLILTSGIKGPHIFHDCAHIHQENNSIINLSSDACFPFFHVSLLALLKVN